MKNNVLILGARPYDFTDEKTGRQITGVSVYVLPMVNEDPANTVGLLPVKYSLTAQQFAEIAHYSFPASADMEMKASISSKKVTFDKFVNVKSIDIAA